MFPAQVTGGRAGDDVRLRRRLAVLSRSAAAAAAAVLAAGYLLVAATDKPADVARNAVATPSATSTNPPTVPVDLAPKGTASSPVAWQIRPTGDRAKDGVLADYRDYVGTGVRLAEEPDPADPALPLVAVDPELGRWRRALSVNSDGQISRHGRVVAMAWVMSLRGGQAIVVGCENTAAQQWYDGPQRRTAWRGGVVVTAAHLVWRSGRWRVYQLSPMSRSHCHS